jgi:hypothetical protein
MNELDAVMFSSPPIFSVTGKHARAQFQLCMNRCDQYGLDSLSTYNTKRISSYKQDQVGNMRNWNNNALMRFSASLKKEIDPNSIMTPGLICRLSVFAITVIPGRLK